jgi:hypothetical protein
MGRVRRIITKVDHGAAVTFFGFDRAELFDEIFENAYAEAIMAGCDALRQPHQQ